MCSFKTAHREAKELRELSQLENEYDFEGNSRYDEEVSIHKPVVPVVSFGDQNPAGSFVVSC